VPGAGIFGVSPPHLLSLIPVAAYLLLLLSACGDDPVGLEPQAEFLPPSLVFETTALGDTAQRKVHVVNRSLKLLEITVSSDSPEFSMISPDSSLSFRLFPGEARAVEMAILFHPVSEALSRGRIQVGGARALPLEVTGNGKIDPCRPDPGDLAFGWVRLGEEKTLTLTLHCDGPDSVEGSVALACGPEFSTPDDGPFALAPRESLRVGITYRPVDRGDDKCVVSFGAEWCEDVWVMATASRVWEIQENGLGDAPTVQAGIDSAGHGDVVLVGPGTYYENINLRGKAIHLKSAEGPETTILDGSRGDFPVVMCHSMEKNDTIIEGFTITGGRGWSTGTPHTKGGGGIDCSQAASVIWGNIIRDNTAGRPGEPRGNSRGGGISFRGPESLPPIIIEDNVITDNHGAFNAGGINVGHAAIIQRNTIEKNSTGGDGGGIYLLVNVPFIIIRDNLFLENRAGDHGGGAYLTGTGRTDLYGNLFIGNKSSTHGLPGCSGAAIFASREVGGELIHIHHNTLIFNDAVNIGGSPAAGGICVGWYTGHVVIENNLIHGNEGGGVATWAEGRKFGTASITHNLISENGGTDIWNSHPELVEVVENIFVDPILCDGVNNTSGRVAVGSPALTQPFGVIGAFPEPGCTEP